MRDAIQCLAARGGVLLEIATGKSRRGASAVLELESLTHHFTTIQTSDTHPSKPHPSMILAAMVEAAAGPRDTLMIGDTTYDIAMALEAGVDASAPGGAITLPRRWSRRARMS